MEQDLHQAEHPRVVDLDTGNGGAPYGDGFGEALEHREVHMHVEEVSPGARDAISHHDEFLAERPELLTPFVQAEIFEPVDADLDPKERAELLVRARHEALAVDAEYVMAMVELLQHRVDFAAEAFVFAHAEDLSDDVGRQTKPPQLTRALEDLVDRKVGTEDEIPAVFNLIQGVGAPQRDCGPVLLGELRPEHERPVVEP